ncbi:DUF1566 domain-containing protein [Parvibium lacunae]|uniref:DUF1566 domain-containing protein n=2 Tax=Parvibium lacunae TaxID=1888893 RepID=A0A368L8U8_9BURK|nr:DUF1566 domain-containing protein [Parvibium lacunae]
MKSNKAQFLKENLREGEVYAGIILGNEEPDYHLFLLPGEHTDIQWQSAMDWAKSIGGNLPTQREQSLLFANRKDEFKGSWYWSCETLAKDSSYAWVQGFRSGGQNCCRKNSYGHARAVRRLLVIE